MGAVERSDPELGRHRSRATSLTAWTPWREPGASQCPAAGNGVLVKVCNFIISVPDSEFRIPGFSGWISGVGGYHIMVQFHFCADD
jgi:hypothetical protein